MLLQNLWFKNWKNKNVDISLPLLDAQLERRQRLSISSCCRRTRNHLERNAHKPRSLVWLFQESQQITVIWETCIEPLASSAWLTRTSYWCSRLQRKQCLKDRMETSVSPLIISIFRSHDNHFCRSHKAIQFQGRGMGPPPFDKRDLSHNIGYIRMKDTAEVMFWAVSQRIFFNFFFFCCHTRQ